MATTYIGYDTTTAIGSMVSELAAHVYAAKALAKRAKAACLTLKDGEDLTALEAHLGIQAGQGAAYLYTVEVTDQQLDAVANIQNLDQGLML